MHHEGDVTILDDLLLKQYHLSRGNFDSNSRRAALLAGTGVMRGTYGVGQTLSLHKHHLNHIFDDAIGVSTGLPNIGYMLAEQERHSIYWKEAASKDFISFSRFLRRKGPLADIDYICRVFGDMDQAAVRRSRTNFWAGVTCARTGQGLFFDCKTVHPDLVMSIRASCSMMGVTDPVEIGGELCFDGATSLTFPVRRVLEQFEPDILLVLANRPGFAKIGAAFDRLSSMPLLRKYPEAVRRVHLGRFETALEELDYLRSQKRCRYLILWSDSEVGRFERNPQKVEQAAMRSERHFSQLLADAKKRVNLESPLS